MDLTIKTSIKNFFGLDKLEDWSDFLEVEVDKGLEDLLIDLMSEYEFETVFPEPEEVFLAMKLVRPRDVKVVILGQDPYHNGSAHGLAFSVNRDSPVPPSLRNIFSEIEKEYGPWDSPHGNLTSWAKQGVLLLNTCLTVVKGKPGSHSGCGWEFLIQRMLKYLVSINPDLIVVCWGRQAENVIHGIPIKNKLSSPHPSPLSASSGFFGNGHFKSINRILSEQNREEVEWTNI